MDKIYYAWRDLMDNKSDPRTRNWFMMNSPLPTIAISAGYILAVKVIGRMIMENRKPIANAKRIQLYYNIFHLTINAYLFYQASLSGWFTFDSKMFSYRCQPVDFSMDGIPMHIASCSWLYYMSKFTDFFETCIFVMLKRFDMINLYHVAHHSIMPVSVWWGVKFMAGGHSTFFAFINTFVHCVIYTYLVIIALFPKTKRTIFFWWKPFYPYFQVTQFALIFIHAFQLFFKNDCNYPISFAYFIGGHAVLFTFLVYGKMKTDAKIAQSKKKDDNNNDHEKSCAESLKPIEEKIQSVYGTSKQRMLMTTTR